MGESTNVLLYSLSNYVQIIRTQYLLDEYAENLASMSGKCMDIGCGPGDITKHLLLPALHPNTVMIGTDFSTKAIDYANKTYTAEGKLTFETLDIQTKKLPKKYISQFDHIFSFHTLHWCSDVSQTFSNIFKMLKRGGDILILTVVWSYLFDIINKISQNEPYSSYIPDVKKYITPYQFSSSPLEECKDMLQNIGFTIERCNIRKTDVVNDLSTFLSSIIAILPFLDKMPDPIAKAFCKELKNEAMKRNTIFENNTYSYLNSYKELIILARK